MTGYLQPQRRTYSRYWDPDALALPAPTLQRTDTKDPQAKRHSRDVDTAKHTMGGLGAEQVL
jgi:hypothetical protein